MLSLFRNSNIEDKSTASYDDGDDEISLADINELDTENVFSDYKPSYDKRNKAFNRIKKKSLTWSIYWSNYVEFFDTPIVLFVYNTVI